MPFSGLLLLSAVSAIAGQAATEPLIPPQSAGADLARVTQWIGTAAVDCGDTMICQASRISLLSSAMAILSTGSCPADRTSCTPEEAAAVDSAIRVQSEVAETLRSSATVLTVERLAQSDEGPQGVENTVASWIAAAESEPCQMSERQCDIGRLWLLGEADQAARTVPECGEGQGACWPRGSHAMQAVDAQIRGWKTEFFQRTWWPVSDIWGSSASHAAWLLVQHSDGDTSFQEDILDRLLMSPSLPADERRHAAYLTDRTAVARRRPQPFGTQGMCGDDGQWSPFATAEPERLGERRQAAGLPPYAQYVSEVGAICR